MKRRDASLFFTLVLALSLSLSPVSAFAEDLDTPVHEDSIDEVQYGADWVNGHFTLYDGPYTTVLDVSVYCNYMWTEGISGWINSAAFNFNTKTINGVNAQIIHESDTITYSSYNTWGRASKEYTFSNSVRLCCC